MTPDAPEQLTERAHQEIDRRQKADLRAILLGHAIALCDVLGLDVEGFIANLRRKEPRPNFRMVPDPKARS